MLLARAARRVGRVSGSLTGAPDPATRSKSAPRAPRPRATLAGHDARVTPRPGCGPGPPGSPLRSPLQEQRPLRTPGRRHTFKASDPDVFAAVATSQGRYCASAPRDPRDSAALPTRAAHDSRSRDA